jgi:hypothetical protein
MDERKLPVLADLVGDEVDVLKNDQFNLLLNQSPPSAWIKQHPFIKVDVGQGKKEGLPYITIQRVEILLTAIFQEWKIEVIGYSQLFNSVSCHVRLHYKSPLDGSWKFHDGLGAVGVQTDKGEAAANLNAIKQDAVMKALPAAKSYAIKDAAEHLGKLFGRDLNRNDHIEFKPTYFTKWNSPE